jgi:hypothetical protein
MNKADFIVKVLLSHPFDGDDDEKIRLAKKKITDRYRELKSDLSFTEAEIASKIEWLESFLK